MRRQTTAATAVLIICGITVAAASADTLAITYRSGKVQTVPMDEPRGEVAGISYLKSSVSSPETKAKVSPSKPAISGGESQQKPAPDSKKHGVTIKWAAPIDQ